MEQGRYRTMKKAAKPTPWRTYAKMGIGGALICIGGPLFTLWLVPSEEELFLRYNPELQKRSLENRAKKQEDFNEFVARLKTMSKSDKPIWEEQAIFEKERKRAGNLKPGKKESEEGPESKGIELRLAEEMLEKKKKLREETGPLVPGGSL